MGVVGNEIADIYAKAAVRERTPDTESRKEMKRISLSFLNSGKGQKRWGGAFQSSTKESQPSTYPACPNPKPKIGNRAPKYAESHSQPPISALKRTYTHIPLPEREMEMHGLRFLLVVQRRQKTRENPCKERREREGKSTLCGKVGELSGGGKSERGNGSNLWKSREGFGYDVRKAKRRPSIGQLETCWATGLSSRPCVGTRV